MLKNLSFASVFKIHEDPSAQSLSDIENGGVCAAQSRERYKKDLVKSHDDSAVWSHES